MQENFKKPLVSIVIPVYNSEKYLQETVQSVINQTYSNWELIIVDDGSLDTSLLIAEKFAIQNQKIQIIEKSNTGVSDSRNVGLRSVKGKYVAFLDSDDVWLPNNLEAKIGLLQNTNVDAAYSFCETINEYSKKLNSLKKGCSNFSLDDMLLWNANYITIPSGLIFKTSVVTSIGGFNRKLTNNADQEILMRLLANNGKVVVYESVTWHYRIHSSNMSLNIKTMEKDTLLTYSIANKKKYFKNYFFKSKCFAKMYLILAGSWWKNGKNKKRGFVYIAKAFIINPFYTTYLLLNKLKK